MAILTLTPDITEIEATVSDLEYIATYDRRFIYTIAPYDTGGTPIQTLFDLVTGGTQNPKSSVTFSGLDPDTHYIVNCDIYRTSDNMKLGDTLIADASTNPPAAYFYVSSIGSRSVEITVDDSERFYDYARLEIYEYNSSSSGSRIYRSDWESIIRGEAIIEYSGNLLSPNTNYIIKCGLAVDTEYGIRSRGYAKDSDHIYRESIDITTKKAGGAHIYTTEWKDASVWIYCTVNGVTDWYEVTPHIYSNGWKETI